MLRLDLDTYLAGAASIAAGMSRGRAAGQQAGFQQQQALEAQRAQEFQQMAALDAASEERKMAAHTLMLQNLKLLAPGGQATVLQGALDQVSGRPASPYNATSYAQFRRTGQMPPSPGSGVPPPAPVPPPGSVAAQFIAGQREAQGILDAGPPPPVSPQPQPVLAAAPAPAGNGMAEYAARFGIAPGAPGMQPGPWGPMPTAAAPAPAGPASVTDASVAPVAVPAGTGAPAVVRPSVTFGGKRLELAAGGVTKERLTRIQQNFTKAQATFQALPEGDPRRNEVQTLIGSLNQNPQTEEEADETERRLNQINFNYAGAGRGQQQAASQTLRFWNEKAPDRWAALKNADPATLPDMLLAFAAEAGEMEKVGSTVGQKPLLPIGFRGEQEGISRLQAALAEEDFPAAQEIAREIGARIKSGMTVAQETARGRLAFDVVSKLSPIDPDFKKKSQKAYEQHGVAHLYPEGGDLSGSAKERYKQSLIGKIPSLKGVSGPGQRPLLLELRRYIKLTGGDPSVVPPEISESMNPGEKASYDLQMKQLNVFEERETARRAKETRDAEAHRVRMQGINQKTSGGLTQAQTLGVKYKNLTDARKAEEAAYGSWTHTDISLDETGKAQVVSYLQKVPGVMEAARKVEALAKIRIQKETEYQNYSKSVQAPGGRTPKQSAPTSGARLSPQQMQGMSTSDLLRRLAQKTAGR